jgi:hypothetical protein
MRKAVVLLLFALLVGAGVWYLVRNVSLLEHTDAREARATAGPPLPPLGPICGGHCGTERWEVKTLNDIDREHVRLRPVDATVEELRTLKPAGVARGRMRYSPAELTVYRVEAYLGGAFTEDDGDWHLVLFGLQDQRASLISEIPDPACAGACRSGFAPAFGRARQLLEERLQRPNPRDEPIMLRVTGVGFFDRAHGQSGAAPNQFELHPVLSIEFPD